MEKDNEMAMEEKFSTFLKTGIFTQAMGNDVLYTFDIRRKIVNIRYPGHDVDMPFHLIREALPIATQEPAKSTTQNIVDFIDFLTTTADMFRNLAESDVTIEMDGQEYKFNPDFLFSEYLH